MRIVYDFPILKQLIMYILIPVFVIIIVFAFLLFRYSRKTKDHSDPIYNYNMNLWSSLLASLLGASLLAVTIGFGMSFIERMEIYSLTIAYKALYYFYLFLPILPMLFLIYFIVKFVKTIKHPPKKEDLDTVKSIEEANNVNLPEENPQDKVANTGEEII